MLLAALSATAACDLEADPTIPCSTLDLADRAERAMLPDSSSVFAVAGTDPSRPGLVTVLRPCHDCWMAELEPVEIDLGSSPSQILLTATGRWLTAIQDDALLRVDLDAQEPKIELLDESVDDLIGALRDSNWVVYRRDGDLWARYVGTDDVGETAFELAPELEDVEVVALGDRNVVARERVSGDEERLWLIRVNPSHHHDNGGLASRGRAIELSQGAPFSRVVMVRGGTPRELGENDAFDSDVPIDRWVVATSGDGADTGRTVVYDVTDGSVVSNFPGAVISSHLPLSDVAGLSAVSPDASHLAYVTRKGSVALRDLDTGGACLVRPADTARHGLAAFAADGSLYFESEDTDGTTVHAYDPLSRAITTLTEAGESFRLKAAPAEAYEIDEASAARWAVVARDGFHAAQSDDRAQALGYEEDRVLFVPLRLDETLWLVEVRDVEEQDQIGSTPAAKVHLRRLQPEPGESALDFEPMAAAPNVADEDGIGPFAAEIDPDRPLCISTARATPWGQRCALVGEDQLYTSGPPSFEIDRN